MRLLLAALLLAPAPAGALSKRPSLAPHGPLMPGASAFPVASNLVNGSKNVRALRAHLDALDRDDPREYREWVTALRLLSLESATLRGDLKAGRALLKRGVEPDPMASRLSFEPGPPLDMPPQEDADGARVALALAAVEEAEPMAAAILLRAQGVDEPDRISAYEAAAAEASLRVAEQRAQLVRLAGEKAAQEATLGKARPAPAKSALPDIMNLGADPSGGR